MFGIEYSQTQYQNGKKLIEVTGIVPDISFETEEEAYEWIVAYVRSRRDALCVGVKGPVYAMDKYLEYDLGPGLTSTELLSWIEL